MCRQKLDGIHPRALASTLWPAARHSRSAASKSPAQEARMSVKAGTSPSAVSVRTASDSVQFTSMGVSFSSCGPQTR